MLSVLIQNFINCHGRHSCGHHRSLERRVMGDKNTRLWVYLKNEHLLFFSLLFIYCLANCQRQHSLQAELGQKVSLAPFSGFSVYISLSRGPILPMRRFLLCLISCQQFSEVTKSQLALYRLEKQTTDHLNSNTFLLLIVQHCGDAKTAFIFLAPFSFSDSLDSGIGY